MFLAGSLLAGVVAGRLARGAKDAGGPSSSRGPSSPPAYASGTTRTHYVSDSSVRDIDLGDPLATPRAGEDDYPTTFRDRP